jgi:hypothetical protein
VTVPDDANRYGRPVRSLNAGRLWTGGVATALVAALAPFLSDADLDEKVATSAITLVVGVAIGSLLSGVARSAVRTGP